MIRIQKEANQSSQTMRNFPILILFVISLLPNNSVALIKGSTCSREELLALSTRRCHENKTISDDSSIEKDDLDRLGQSSSRVGAELFSLNQIKSIEKFFYSPQDFNLNYTVSEFDLLALTAKAQVSFNEMPIHRYSNYEDLKWSGGLEANQELCLGQLDELNQRANLQIQDKTQSKDLNLHQLLDTFGRKPSGMLLVNTFWPGMYRECLRLKIISNKTSSLDTRYCVASIKNNHWPKSGESNDYFTLKVGVCLPRSCDSFKYRNKYILVKNLLEFNSREIDKEQSSLTDLYCLPDDESPTRSWWFSGRVKLILTIAFVWLSALLYSTLRYEKLKRRYAHQTSPICSTSIELLKSLSLINNFKLLFDLDKSGDAQEEKKLVEEKLGLINKTKIVDFRTLDGIKVICMFYVVAGHILICLVKVITNVRELTDIRVSNILYIISNVTPNNAVDVFLVITGLLTSYSIFKKEQAHVFVQKPMKWIMFVMYRYLRIMPTYLIVFIYMKYLSKFTGSGPFWDYGTSALTPRRRCEQESWSTVLLLQANLKPVFQHCVPTGWYLASDVQFFMIAPLLLAILHWLPKLGKGLLIVSTLVGSLACCLSIMFSMAPDLRTAFKFMPQTYLIAAEVFLAESYTWPQYRIPAYLIGLLLGYSLFKYEKSKLEYLNDREKRLSKKIDDDMEKTEAEWPELFKRYCPLVSLLCLILNASWPIIGVILKCGDFCTRLTVAAVWPASHIIVSLAVGLYILLACTGYGNRAVNLFLSASFWKPLAKLSLCVVLINFEVISYIMQVRTQALYLDFSIHLSMIILCLLCTYLLAIALHLTIEAPASIALNKFRILLTKSKVETKIENKISKINEY